MASSSSSAFPATTRYHRWLGWHAPALRRVLTFGVSGLIVILALLPFVPWELAVVGGWDVAAVALLVYALADHPPSGRRRRRAHRRPPG